MQSIFIRSPNDELVQANDSDNPSTMNSFLLITKYARPAKHRPSIELPFVQLTESWLRDKKHREWSLNIHL